MLVSFFCLSILLEFFIVNHEIKLVLLPLQTKFLFKQEETRATSFHPIQNISIGGICSSNETDNHIFLTSYVHIQNKQNIFLWKVSEYRFFFFSISLPLFIFLSFSHFLCFPLSCSFCWLFIQFSISLANYALSSGTRTFHICSLLSHVCFL